MIILDAHAHIYSCYHLDDFFSSAFENFRTAKESIGVNNATALIFLTDVSTTGYFDLLRDDHIEDCSSTSENSWTISRTGEHCSLRLRDASCPDDDMFLISGQQIVTAEKLEVLAIGCLNLPESGLAITDTIRSVFADDGFVILPWGVGKWIGKRGRIIKKTVARNKNPLLFLGDNGSRPGFWPVSSFTTSEHSNRPRLLSGTDPLPLKGEEKRVGTFGSVIHGDIDPQNPFKTLKKLLSDRETMFTGYGDLQSSISFVRQQVALRRTR